uniref:Uncharacterized protein n=1 Tax=Brassica campestris TaxID=3711 RepID=M4DM24_BRACM
MPPLETPISGACTNLPTVAPGEEASTRKKSKHAQTYDGEDSDSEPEPDKEASDGAARAESPMIAHLHQFFSDILDAMQFMQPSSNQARLLRSDRARAKLGLYVATEHAYCSVATWPPSSSQARSLRSDRARVLPGRYVATQIEPSLVAS